MSLFSLDNILLQENNDHSTDIINLNNIGIIDNDVSNYSFVREGYKFILEKNKEFHDTDKIFYKTILESCGKDVVINEAFNDFFSKVKEIIKKFIEWIKKTVKNFIVKLNSLFKSDSYLKKNKNTFLKFSSEHEFEFTGYKFTYINDPTIPLANAYDFIDGLKYKMDNYYNDLTDTKTTVNADNSLTTDEDRNKEVAKKMNEKISSNIETLEDGLDELYDKFRGIVLAGKSDNEISASDFSKELFELFRDGYSSTISITIDSNFVSEAYRRFDNYKDSIKSVEKTRDNIIKDYEKLEKSLDSAFKIVKDIKNNAGKSTTTTYNLDYGSSSSNTYASARMNNFYGSGRNDDTKVLPDSTVGDKLNSYAKLLATVTNNMSSIHTQAFTAKLQAIKDCFSQDKKILYKALSIITKKKEET